VTSAKAMVMVERVLSGQINKDLAAALVRRKVPAVGLSCRDGGIMTGEIIPGFERAARPGHVHLRLITALLQNKFLPVLSSVASDKKGNAVNINADDAASALAIALKADNLVFLTNVAGVLNQNKKRIPVLRTSRINELINKKIIHGGMIPKVQSAREAIKKGVRQITIVNGHQGIKVEGGTKIIK
jgi:acetylglutamate kinase